MFGRGGGNSAATLREARQHASDAILHSLEVSERHNLLTASLRDHLVDLTREVSARDEVLREQQALISKLQAREKHLEGLVHHLQREANALRGQEQHLVPVSRAEQRAAPDGTCEAAAQTDGPSFAAALPGEDGLLGTSGSMSSVGVPCSVNPLSSGSSAGSVSSRAGWTSAFTSPTTSLGGIQNLSDDVMTCTHHPITASEFCIYSNPLADTTALASTSSCPLSPVAQRVRSCPGTGSQPRKEGGLEQMHLEGLRAHLADVLAASEAAASSATASEAELRTLQRQYQALLEDKLCHEGRSQQVRAVVTAAQQGAH